MVGTVGGWDPWAHLEELVGEPLDAEALNERRYAHELSLLEAEELRPGHLGLPRGGGAPRHQAGDRLELRRAAGSTCTSRGSSARSAGTRSSPPTTTRSARSRSPTLYLEALDVLGVDAGRGGRVRGLAERRPRGAKRAGIYVVGIPNSVTRDLGLDGAADLVVDSLADLPPDELLARFG